MALYPISREGIKAFEQLKKDLSKLNTDIENEGNRLRTAVNAQTEGSGYLWDQVKEAVNHIEKHERDNSANTAVVIKLIEKRISQIEEYLNQGL